MVLLTEGWGVGSSPFCFVFGVLRKLVGHFQPSTKILQNNLFPAPTFQKKEKKEDVHKIHNPTYMNAPKE
jgi:hypothetical protein